MPSIAAASAPDTPPDGVLPAASLVAVVETSPGDAPPAASLAASLAAAVEAVEQLGACSADYDTLTDAELLAGQKNIARLRGLVDTRSVWLAKTLAHRSRPELGQRGLAARQGFLSPADLIQEATGCTRADARKIVDVGRMLGDTEIAQAAVSAHEEQAHEEQANEEQAAQEQAAEEEGAGSGGADGPAGGVDGGNRPDLDPGTTCTPPPVLPWYSPISDAVTAGTLSVAAAHAIRTGLGTIDFVITAAVLGDAVQELLTEARTMTVDALLKRSRRMRDSLDEAGIATREQKAWDDRYLRIWTSSSGQVHLNGQFPPEQGAFLQSVYDSTTGPRRGGVRFVDPDRAAWAKAIQDDPRSTDQLTADTFIELIKAGSTVNPNRLLGGRTPAVQVLTTAPTPAPAREARPDTTTRPPVGRTTAPEPAPAPAPAAPPNRRTTTGPPGRTAADPPPPPDPTDLLVSTPDGSGHGFIEGNPAPVSQETIDRLICTNGTIQIAFDDHGQPLNLGREQRIFTAAQRLALAARDGGCRWGNCDRPPSQTEAHHLEEWVRDNGATDIRVGILLCPSHHRLLHNQGWQIFENQGIYWLRPPARVDPGQTLIRLRRKSPAAQEQHPPPDGPHQHRDDTC